MLGVTGTLSRQTVSLEGALCARLEGSTSLPHSAGGAAFFVPGRRRKEPLGENGLLQSVETRGPAKSKQQLQRISLLVGFGPFWWQTSLNLFSAIPSGSEVMTSEFLR